VVVFAAEAMVVPAVTMAKAASIISKATKAARKVPEHPGNPAHASLAESLSIRLMTAKHTL
jgi:hypothetical protein